MGFKQEATNWLSPLGYTLHSYSSDERVLTFSNAYEEHSPIIRCYDINGQKTCSLSGGPFFLFIKLSVDDLMFKHPDIERYIKTFTHYSEILSL